MRFWASAEVFGRAFPALDNVRRSVEQCLNIDFAASSLATLDGKLRYVPIVMPEGMRERYPARSELRWRERTYDCAPQLNYDVFVDGTFESQLKEYVGGIAESALHLAELGATPEQVTDFERILSTTIDHILANQTDQTRP